MNPLMIARGIGKQVDLLLRDLRPVSDSNFLAHAGNQFGQVLECFHGLNVATYKPGCKKLLFQQRYAGYASSQLQMPGHCARSFSTRPGATSNSDSPCAARWM